MLKLRGKTSMVTWALLGHSLNPIHKLTQLRLDSEVQCSRISPDLAEETEFKLRAEARRPCPLHLMVQGSEFKSCSSVTSYVALGHDVASLEKLFLIMCMPVCLCM